MTRRRAGQPTLRITGEWPQHLRAQAVCNKQTVWTELLSILNISESSTRVQEQVGSARDSRYNGSSRYNGIGRCKGIGSSEQQTLRMLCGSSRDKHLSKSHQPPPAAQWLRGSMNRGPVSISSSKCGNRTMNLKTCTGIPNGR